MTIHLLKIIISYYNIIHFISFIKEYIKYFNILDIFYLDYSSYCFNEIDTLANNKLIIKINRF